MSQKTRRISQRLISLNKKKIKKGQKVTRYLYHSYPIKRNDRVTIPHLICGSLEYKRKLNAGIFLGKAEREFKSQRRQHRPTWEDRYWGLYRGYKLFKNVILFGKKAFPKGLESSKIGENFLKYVSKLEKKGFPFQTKNTSYDYFCKFSDLGDMIDGDL